MRQQMLSSGEQHGVPNYDSLCTIVPLWHCLFHVFLPFFKIPSSATILWYILILCVKKYFCQALSCISCSNHDLGRYIQGCSEKGSVKGLLSIAVFVPYVGL